MPMELVADHDDLRCKMRDFTHLMMVDPPDMKEVMRRRIDFSRTFSAHMSHEDKAITALRSGPCRIGQGVAIEHGARIRSLFLRYSDHIKHWAPAQMTRDWTGYRSGVSALQNGLYDLMDWEEDHIFPHLTETSRHAA